jgi:hypothetical protein
MFAPLLVVLFSLTHRNPHFDDKIYSRGPLTGSFEPVKSLDLSWLVHNKEIVPDALGGESHVLADDPTSVTSRITLPRSPKLSAPSPCTASLNERDRKKKKKKKLDDIDVALQELEQLENQKIKAEEAKVC